MMRKVFFIVLLVFSLSVAFAAVPKHTADSIANLLNQREVICDRSCPLFESENSNSGLVNTIFIDVLAAIGTVWLFTNYKKKYIIGIGAAVVIVVTGSFFFHINSGGNQCIEYSNSNLDCKAVASGQKPKAVSTATDSLSDFQQIDSSTDTAAASAEFSSISPSDAAAAPLTVSSPSVKITDPNIMDPLIAFALLALISIGMKYPAFIRFRGLFLLAGVVWFGFYRGGCNCMIGSFQDLISGIASWKFAWTHLVWLGVLIIATFLFGRIWCGWLCHLGGVQDFLFRSSKLNFLSSAKSQKYLRFIRYFIFTAWIVQLVCMRQNLFCSYDPFKSLFNLIFTDWTSISLLLLLLVSSVLVYRPFCRIFCPVGVILGWISSLPGARKMKIGSGCINCGSCARGCEIHAVSYSSGKTVINTVDCIACGECSANCRKKCIKNVVK
jgi:NAD-dependent dihydropyrimidine dehydrogenase PreA subunit